jgi:hypothetical protein
MKSLKQLWNHKIKYPGSISYYTTIIVVGGNAHNKAELEANVLEIYPALEKWLLDRGLMLEKVKS